MGIITLTDRISVRVSAKNDTQSNDYKKATGGAIGKTLGNEDISDELKTQLGNTTKPVITDEDGNAWISMADIIAAGKAMNGDGAFEEKTSYRHGNVPCVNLYSLPICSTWGSRQQFSMLGPLWYHSNGTMLGVANYIGVLPQDTMGAVVRLISTGEYYFLASSESGAYKDIQITFENGSGGTGMGNSGWVNLTTFNLFGSPGLVPVSDVGQLLSLTNYGDLHEETSGGSLIDWTKSDAEIEEDIRDLHETWDVSEHEGSVTANGTYVLAGPIEFNPGD